ncbi:MAG: glycosyltransferase family 4 protein, partial [Candidatus Binatia bacterium]
FIFYLGRAEPYKNNRGLIRAHQLLLSKFPALELLIVGKKEEFRARDETWVFEQNYTNVTFIGAISDEQLVWLYENCRAYVIPSFMEGFGLPSLEAMLHGAPVASSNATCLPEVLGDAALYFDPHNPTNMAAVIERLLSDTTLAGDLRKKGYEQAGQYSWRRMAEQTLEVYEHALAA